MRSLCVDCVHTIRCTETEYIYLKKYKVPICTNIVHDAVWRCITREVFQEVGSLQIRVGLDEL